MSISELPIAARDIPTLMLLGSLHAVGRHPLTVVSLVRGVGGTDSIWIDLGYPIRDYLELWRLVYPGEVIPAGCEVKPLLILQEAARSGFRLARLGLVSIVGASGRFNGKYFVQGTTHKYQQGSGEGGYKASDGRFLYRS